MRRELWTATALLGLFASVAAATEGERLYRAHCAACHGSAGEGGGSASALAGSDAVTDAARVAQVIREGTDGMPGFPALKDGEVLALARFVRNELGGGPTEAPDEPELSGQPANGLAFFTGRKRLSAGGAACAACHTVRGQHGGRLGNDLTGALQRYGGAVRLSATLESMPFRVMRASYDGKALTAQERADLAAFFQGLEEEVGTEAEWVHRFWVAGLVGAATLFAGVALIGFRRGPSPARRLRRASARGRQP
jgi:mono/diheme cytochrome c family protein